MSVLVSVWCRKPPVATNAPLVVSDARGGRAFYVEMLRRANAVSHVAKKNSCRIGRIRHARGITASCA